MGSREHPGAELRARIARAGVEERTLPLSPLLHEDRARLFQGCIDLLCARAGTIAHLSGMSRGSGRWHLEILVKDGYVDLWDTAFGTRYAPCGAVSDSEMAKVLSLLLSPGCAKAVAAVSASPGITTKEVQSPRTLPQLERTGLLHSVRDGRAVRWYSGENLILLHRAVEAGRARFLSRLIELLEQHRVGYSLSETRPLLSIDLHSPYGPWNFGVPSDLLASALSRHTILCKSSRHYL
ncbi:MAG: hypothetical protein AB1665_08995 [Candidatus Thermoplasmatota archaeon]